jgi:hypothetical protein
MLNKTPKTSHVIHNKLPLNSLVSHHNSLIGVVFDILGFSFVHVKLLKLTVKMICYDYCIKQKILIVDLYKIILS